MFDQIRTAFEERDVSVCDRSYSENRNGLRESRELVLAPRQRHEVIETVTPEASHVAVVALFRAPAEPRWRFVFDARAAARTGITLGLHGCAMSVAEGPVIDAAPETLRVAGVHCR